jgi:hypothetical protein
MHYLGKPRDTARAGTSRYADRGGIRLTDMHYELWTVPAGNMIDDFASEDEALALVRELIAGAPPQAADALLLTLARDDGSGVTIAAGAASADRAHRHTAPEVGRPTA